MDIPTFPDETNIARFRDFIDVQKSHLELLMAEKTLRSEIGIIDLQLERRIIQRRQNEKRMMDEIQTKVLEHQVQVAAAVGTVGAARERANQIIQDIEDEMDAKWNLINMSQEANRAEMDMAKRRYADAHRFSKFAFSQAKELFGIKVNEYDLTKKIGTELFKLGGISRGLAYTLAAIVVMLQGAYKLFLKFDKAAWDFRKAMGMTRAESAVIQKIAQRIAIDYMHIGVTVESVYKSYQALGKSMGGVHNVSAELVKDVSVMAAQLGISEEMSARFLRNLASVSKSSMESQSNMMYMAQAMSSAAGVQLSDVMGDVATKSSKTLIMMSRLPNVALRSAIELRRMGTDMNAVADSSRHILDFTESVNEEMEASVLLGRGINLQRARELAYRRDLVGSTKEILRITKQVNFEKLDVFQQQAYAAATGKSVEELLNMLQTDKQIEQIRRRGTPEQKAQLALYEKMSKENAAAAKARAKDVGLMIQAKANQERITAITAKWNQLLAKIQQVFLPVIDKFLGFIVKSFDTIKWISIVIGGIWLANKLIILATNRALIFQNLLLLKNRLSAFNIGRSLGYGMAKYLPGITRALLGLGPMLFAFGMNIVGWAGTLWTSISGIFTGLLPFLGTLLTTSISGIFAMGIGAIMTAAGLVIASAIGGWAIGTWLRKKFAVIDEFATWVWLKLFDMWDGAVSGIKSVSSAIYGWMKWPFDKFANWWYGTSGIPGKSPSAFGLSIVEGIKSVGGMLFDVLTSPFRKAFTWIMDKFASIGKFVGKLFGAGKAGGSVEKKATAAYIPAVTVSPKGTEVASLKKKPGEAGKESEKDSPPMSEATGQKICSLLEKILAKDNNIKMDGQLLSTHLARQTEFRGGYGVNKVA